MNTNPTAVTWSAVLGLFPGYRDHYNNFIKISVRRNLFIRLWNEAMVETFTKYGFVISCSMSDVVVLYPVNHGCPDGGEKAISITGSSNPDFVKPEELSKFMDAVEETVKRVQIGMEQTTCRIEFTYIHRSIYSKI